MLTPSNAGDNGNGVTHIWLMGMPSATTIHSGKDQQFLIKENINLLLDSAIEYLTWRNENLNIHTKT